jgi:hypothetical protein
MLPVGKYEQNEDLTGYDNHEYQTHRSYWYINDILKLQFTKNIIDLKFHPKHCGEKINNVDTACYFGTWEKYKI